TPAFATRWLVTRLAGFQREYPRLQLRIVASPSPVDFEQEDVDVAIRLGRGAFGGVQSYELFREWIAPVATPAFLRQHRLRKPADIARLPLVHDESMRRAGRPQGWREWFRSAGVAQADLRRGTHFDDGHLALQAAAAGGGIALGRLVYAMDDLAARRLRIAVPPLLEMDVSYYLLVPEIRANRPAVMAFRQWIEGEAAVFRSSFAKLVGRESAAVRRAGASRGTRRTSR
ncbi:MAG TPA: LysR substrate-binding domain-containing protein, partial [Steroidobacteraceae bacterium]